MAEDLKDSKISPGETIDGDRGRIEIRATAVIHDVASLRGRHHRPGLKGVVIVASIREIGDEIEREARFSIASPVLTATLPGPIAQSHWAVGNSLHRVMA